MKKIVLLFLILNFVSEGFAQNKSRTLFDNANFEVEPLKKVNTIGSDISPVIVGDELFFAAVREEYFHNKLRESKNMAFYDMYSSPLDSNGMTHGMRKLLPGFGAKFHEGPASYCKATGELFTTLSNTIYPDTVRKMFPVENIKLRLVIKRKINGLWKTTEELPFNNHKYHFAHPAISITGDTLVFSSDLDKENFGKTDLFMSIRKSGKWSDPINLGKEINTPGNEMFPTFLPGGILSFASDGHKGSLGGLDIWYTTFPKIGEILNAGDKINSIFDDFGLVFQPDLKTGYFTSNRPGTGSDDIYCLHIKSKYKIFRGKVVDDFTNLPITSSSLQLIDCNHKLVATTQSDSIGNFQFEITGNDCLLVEASKETYQEDRKDISGVDYVDLRLKKDSPYLTIKVIDKETEKTLSKPNLLVLAGAYDSKSLKIEEYLLRMKLNASTNYKFEASERGYFPNEALFSSVGKVPGEYTLIIPLEQLVPGKEFILENLYYDLDKYNIRPDAAIILNRLVRILNENPDVKIEIGSHTDCRGSQGYNMRLSQNRSNSVVAYLISKGIAPGRVQAKGYGETKLINKCADGVSCTEAEHQANRRTVVKIKSY